MIYLTGGFYSCLGGSFWGGRGKGEENERRTGRRKGREHAPWLAAKKSLAQRRNKSHSFWGLLFCSLERGLILLLQSLVLSSKDKAPVLCFTTCKPFSFCCLRDTRAQPLSPQGSTASMCYDTSPPLACQQPLRVILGRPDSAELKTSLSQLLWSENNP